MEQAEIILQMTPRSHRLKNDEKDVGGKERPQDKQSFGRISIDKDDSFFNFWQSREVICAIFAIGALYIVLHLCITKCAMIR